MASRPLEVADEKAADRKIGCVSKRTDRVDMYAEAHKCLEG
jgi:hypothetical protein